MRLSRDHLHPLKAGWAEGLGQGERGLSGGPALLPQDVAGRSGCTCTPVTSSGKGTVQALPAPSPPTLCLDLSGSGCRGGGGLSLSSCGGRQQGLPLAGSLPVGDGSRPAVAQLRCPVLMAPCQAWHWPRGPCAGLWNPAFPDGSATARLSGVLS